MNRALLLGSLFLRVSAVYASATHGDLIAEGRKRNEEAYERNLEQTGWKEDKFYQDRKTNSERQNNKNSESNHTKNS